MSLYVIGVVVTWPDGTVKREILDADWRLPDMLANSFASECNMKYAQHGRYYQTVNANQAEVWLGNPQTA